MKKISQHFDRWRQEPEPHRQRRALFIAFSFTVCLFILWLASFRFSASLRAQPDSVEVADSSLSSESGQQLASPGIIERIKAGWRVVIK